MYIYIYLCIHISNTYSLRSGALGVQLALPGAGGGGGGRPMGLHQGPGGEGQVPRLLHHLAGASGGRGQKGPSV